MDDVDRPIILDGLARRLFSRFSNFKDEGHFADLERAISLGRHAVELASKSNHPGRPTFLNGLSLRLHAKYRQISSIEDLKESISLAREAVNTTPEKTGIYLASRQQNLSDRLNLMYQLTQDLSYPAEAIELNKSAIHAKPPNSYLAGGLCNLGNKLFNMYKRTGDIKDLDEAIQCGRKALDQVPLKHIDRPNILNCLGNCLAQKFERSGSLTDLEEALLLNQKSVQETDPENPIWPTLAADLCNRWIQKYERTGDLDDIQRAISQTEDALERIPKKRNEIDRGLILNTLSLALHARYKHTSAMSDLDLAISCSQKAVEEVPQDYFYRYKQSFQCFILSVIEYRQIVLGATALDHADRAAFLADLGGNFSSMYERSGAIEHLEKAISYHEQALSYPISNLDRLRFLYGLGNLLVDRFNAAKNLKDLEEAISATEEASRLLEEIPHHPLQANVNLSMALKLQKRYYVTRDAEDLERAERLFTDTTGLLYSTPYVRLDAAVKLGLLYMREKRWKDASHALEDAINLIPLLSWRSLVQKDQQHALAQYGGLAPEAAAVALQAGRPAAEALRQMELSRGIIANYRLEARNDISNLEEEHAELAQEYQRAVSERQAAAIRLEKLLEQIRQQPNFDKFLLAFDPSELLASELSAAIVVVNVSPLRCDAILVTKHGTESFLLPDLHYREVHQMATQLKSRNFSEDEMFELLKWLWDVAAGPILERLGILKGPEGADWPRIWWIPTGLMCYTESFVEPVGMGGAVKKGLAKNETQ
ncbi:hypothetical protein BDZ91DRAFT_767912 [Kalaharituber pfeilii]|nr:hypothetical protein BDZ91DRAFT_767912 [Kalaharituber pfeilii]